MQCLNSIENFIFSSDIDLMLEDKDDASNDRNFNITQRNERKIRDENNNKIYSLVPMKLFGSILSLYFYSITPKKTFDIIERYYQRDKDSKYDDLPESIPHHSQIKSENSFSDNDFFQDSNMSSMESENFGGKNPVNFEDFILIKLNQCDIYLFDYNINESIIEYKCNNDNHSYKFKFKHSTIKEKNYIKTLMIIEGYKFSIKKSFVLNSDTKKLTSDLINTEFLIHFLDNCILNKYKILIIDEKFFQEDQSLLKIFTECLTIFREIKLEINLYEDDNTHVEENILWGDLGNTETCANAFVDRFNLNLKESEQSKINVNYFNNILVIDVSNTFMNNKGFHKAILPLIQKCPFLEKLLLNNNFLTDEFFSKINYMQGNTNLKILDLSYNKIKGVNLSKNLRLIVTTFFEIEMIILKGNMIETSFINKFNPVHFNELIKKVRTIINSEDKKEEKKIYEFKKIKIDLRENLIDIEKQEKKFYLWKSDLFEQYIKNKNTGCDDYIENDTNEVVNKKDKESTQEKNNNININENNEKKFYDYLYKAANNFILLFDFPYKGKNYFLEENKKNKNIKTEFRIEVKKLIPKKNIEVNYNRNLIYGSLDYYKEIFKFLFLIDYYFDPILNSFSHTHCAFFEKHQEPLSPNNENVIFEKELNKYISLDKRKVEKIEDKCKSKYQDIIKSLFKPTIYKITRYVNRKSNQSNKIIPKSGTNVPKSKQNSGNIIYYIKEDNDEFKISTKFEYKELPRYEASTIYYSYKYYTNKYKSIYNMAKEILHIKDKDLHPETGIPFNPNSYIKQLLYFYEFIISLVQENNNNLNLNLIAFNKLISRIKIECYLSLTERDCFALEILRKITYGLSLKPYDSKTKNKYKLLKSESKIIDEGLENIINCIDKSDIFLINSYLDIFIAEAKQMNYQSELTFLAEYIQFLRNNLLRKKIYEEIYKIQNSSTYVTKVQNDFDPIYYRYIKLSKELLDSIPKEIVYKEMCLHPFLLDYLKISSYDKDVLLEDLDKITEFIINNPNNTNLVSEYGIRNIYNRLTFLFMDNTKKKYPKKYGYSLSRKNIYLKLARLLFRYSKELDKNNIYHELILENHNKLYQTQEIFDSNNLNASLTNIVYNMPNFNTNFKTTNKIMQSLNKEITAGKDVIENTQKLKLEILKFSIKPQIFPIIDIKSELKDLSKEQRKIFYRISYKFYAKLLEINNCINQKKIYFTRMYRRIKELIRYILNIKNAFEQKQINPAQNEQLLKTIYKEMFYSCLKFMNRNNFSFSWESILYDKNKNIGRYSFGVLYILSFYLDFNMGMKTYIKEFLLDLYINKYYPSYCKNMLHGLNNNFRYDWVMSTFEIHNRLFNQNKMEVKVYFTNDKYETYYIDEHTRTYDLFLEIFNKSEIFSQFKDKKLYWIYLIENDPLKDELLPETMKTEYEEEIANLKSIMNENNTNKVDYDKIQYLNDNKCFNKDMFSLHPDNKINRNKNRNKTKLNETQYDFNNSSDVANNDSKNASPPITTERKNDEKEVKNIPEIDYNLCSNKHILRINLKSNELVLEFLGKIEEKLHMDFSNKLQQRLIKYTEDIEEEVEEDKENSDDDSSKKSGKYYESPNKILPDEAFKHDLVFNYFHFQIGRRFFLPNILDKNLQTNPNVNLNIFTKTEQETIFEQTSKLFTYDYRNTLVQYDVGKKLGILLIVNTKSFNEELKNSTKLKKYQKEFLYPYFFPIKILRHASFKNISMGELDDLIKKYMKMTKHQESLIQEFLKLCVNYKEFFSTIYENVYIEIINYDLAENYKLNENLELLSHMYINICINIDGISFLDIDTYKEIMHFSFSDLVKVYLKDEYTIKLNLYKEEKKYPIELKILLIFSFDEEKSFSVNHKKIYGLKKNINFNEYDAYFLYEDIISLIQLNLIINTKTDIISKFEDFNYVFHDSTSENFDVVKQINEEDLKKFKSVRNESDCYKKYLLAKKEKLNYKEKKVEVKKDKSDTINNDNIYEKIVKNNPEIAVQKKINELSSDNQEAIEDFLPDVKTDNSNIITTSKINSNSNNNTKRENIENKTAKKKEVIKESIIDIESLLNKYSDSTEIMNEIDEEQKKWEEKINSSTSSFSLQSLKEGNIDYKVNLCKYGKLNQKEKKHLVSEKKVIKSINKANQLLKEKGLDDMSVGKKSEDNSNTSKGNNDSRDSYLSIISKKQKYPY